MALVGRISVLLFAFIESRARGKYDCCDPIKFRQEKVVFDGLEEGLFTTVGLSHTVVSPLLLYYGPLVGAGSVLKSTPAPDGWMVILLQEAQRCYMHRSFWF